MPKFIDMIWCVMEFMGDYIIFPLIKLAAIGSSFFTRLFNRED